MLINSKSKLILSIIRNDCFLALIAAKCTPERKKNAIHLIAGINVNQDSLWKYIK